VKRSPTKRAPDAGDSAQSQAVFYAFSFFQLDGFAVPAPAQVTQTVSLLIAKPSKLMLKKLLITFLVSLVLVSCGSQDLNSSQPPSSTIAVKTPLIAFTETATPTVEKSATPFPDEKSLKAITDDGNWEISVLLGYESTIQVASVGGKIKWVLDEKTLPDILLGQLWNYKTSNDRNSLFFGLNSYQSETIILHRWPPSYGLYKLDLTDGKVETILKPHIDSSSHVTYGYFALSPDESQMIYSWWDEPSIIIRNVATLEEQIVSLPENYQVAGPFVWSPNGKFIIFTMWSNVWDYPTDFQVARLGLDDRAIHSLYSDNEENRFFIPTEWVKEDLVYFVDRRTNEQWQINPFTGQLQERISTTP
jgi:hypothetical protein